MFTKQELVVGLSDRKLSHYPRPNFLKKTQKILISVAMAASLCGCEETPETAGGDPSATPTATTTPSFSPPAVNNTNSAGGQVVSTDTGRTAQDDNNPNSEPNIPVIPGEKTKQQWAECSHYVVKGASEWGASLRDGASPASRLLESLQNGTKLKRFEPATREGSYLKVESPSSPAVHAYIDEMNLECAEQAKIAGKENLASQQNEEFECYEWGAK